MLWSASERVRQPAFLKADAPAQPFALARQPSPAIDGFRIEKQVTFDLCWAAVAVSAARFRKLPSVPSQSGMVELYATSGQQACPCSDRPGDNGLFLWCVDCAFRMIALPYTELTSMPTFDAIAEAMARQKPICMLRDYAAGAHYVVIVGAYRTAQGQPMVSIADPDRSQPDVRDIAHNELLEGDGRAVAWYRF